MHSDVVNEEPRDASTGGEEVKQQVKSQSDQVRGIQPPDATLPKRAELNLFPAICRLRFCPLQVNAKAGDHEEKKDANVSIGAEKLDYQGRPFKDVCGHCVLRLLNGVVDHHTERGKAAKSINGRQPPAV